MMYMCNRIHCFKKWCCFCVCLSLTSILSPTLLWGTDVFYTDLGTSAANPASINIDGTLTLTSTTNVGNPTELDAPTYTGPKYTGPINAGGIVVNSNTTPWVSATTKSQVLTGNLTIGTGGITVNSGVVLKIDGDVTFSGDSSIKLADDTRLMGIGTITAGGNISFTQTSKTINWGETSWLEKSAYDVQNNFILSSSNHSLNIDYASDRSGFSGTISGAGKVTINNSTTGDTRILEMKGTNSYTGGTEIIGRFTSSSKASTLVRVYQSDEISETYSNSSSSGTNQYYYTRSLGTGTITLQNAVISNGDQQCVTLANELYIPSGCWGVIRPGSASSATHVKYFDIAGKITGGGAIYISKDSGTALIRNSSNDYSGGTFIGNSPSNLTSTYPATIEIGADNCLGTGPVTLNETSSVLDLNGHELTIGGLSSEKYSKPGEHSEQYLTEVYLFDGATSHDATLTVTGGTEYVYAGKFTDKDGGNPLTEMVKTGEGTQTFVSNLGADLHLTIEEGTVKLSRMDCINEEGISVVSSGGILQSPRVLNGAITTDYTLTYDAEDKGYLEINGGDYTTNGVSSGTLRVDIGSRTQHSRFNLPSKPTYTEGIGFVDVNLLSYEPEAEDYFILSYDTSDNGKAFDDYAVTTSLEDWLLESDRDRWDLTWYYGDVKYGTSLVLEYRERANIPEVPEPSSIVLLFIGMGVLRLRRSRWACR